jgi:hypothetical protein
MRFRERFKASNEQVDSLLRFWGGGSSAGIPLAYSKLNRAARGERGDGTLVAVAEAHLYGWREARTLAPLRGR